MDEFWQLVNPEIEETCSFEKVLNILKIFVYLAVVLRLKIEKSKSEEE